VNEERDVTGLLIAEEPSQLRGKRPLGTGLHNCVHPTNTGSAPDAKVTFTTNGRLLIQNSVFNTCDHVPVLVPYSSATTWSCF
jgi:hypothetical protein